MDNRKKKKIIKIILILLGVVMAAGIILYGVGQGISSNPLMIAGLIVAGISFVPTVIMSIILQLKQGSW